MRIAFLVFSIVATSISTSFFCYCLVQFKKFRAEPFFLKRRPILVLTTLIVLYLAIIAECAFEALYYAEVTENSVLTQILDATRWTLFVVSYMIGPVFLIRMWLLYYDMQLTQSLQNQHWQMAINPFMVSSNWFLKSKNQTRYGKSGKYLIIAAVLFAIYQNISFYISVVTKNFHAYLAMQIQVYAVLILQVELQLSIMLHFDI